MGDSDVFWAAFGGGAAAGILTLVAVCVAEWLRWFLDRSLLKIEAYLGNIAQVPRGQVSVLRGKRFGHNYVFFEAINPHTNPVTVSSFGLEFKRKKWGRLQVNPHEGFHFPFKIEGQTNLIQWSPMAWLIETLQEGDRRPSDLKWVWFKSSGGKLFRNKITSETMEALEEVFRSASAVGERAM